MRSALACPRPVGVMPGERWGKRYPPAPPLDDGSRVPAGCLGRHTMSSKIKLSRRRRGGVGGSWIGNGICAYVVEAMRLSLLLLASPVRSASPISTAAGGVLNDWDACVRRRTGDEAQQAKMIFREGDLQLLPGGAVFRPVTKLHPWFADVV